MQFRIDMSDVRATAELWRRAPEIMGEEMYRSVVEADKYIQGELQQNLPRGAAGLGGAAGLAGSVATEEQRMADNVVGAVFSPLEYAVYVETGTRPHFPPIEPLEDWVQQKLGIEDERERRSVAFLIARKISVKGTPADGTWGRVHDLAEPYVERKLAEGVDRVLDRLGAPA